MIDIVSLWNSSRESVCSAPITDIGPNYCLRGINMTGNNAPAVRHTAFLRRHCTLKTVNEESTFSSLANTMQILLRITFGYSLKHSTMKEDIVKSKSMTKWSFLFDLCTSSRASGILNKRNFGDLRSELLQGNLINFPNGFTAGQRDSGNFSKSKYEVIIITIGYS